MEGRDEYAARRRESRQPPARPLHACGVRDRPEATRTGSPRGGSRWGACAPAGRRAGRRSPAPGARLAGLRRPAHVVSSVEADVEEDHAAGEDAEDERVRARDADRKHPQPEIEAETERPEERGHAAVEARLAGKVHRSSDPSEGAWLVSWLNRTKKTIWRLGTRGHLCARSFAEPITLPSTHPGDFRLPATALRICFVLPASRARRKGDIRGAGRRLQDPETATSRYLRKVQFSTVALLFGRRATAWTDQ